MIIKSENQSLKTAQILERISKISIYLAVFLLPLFFLPLTLNILDFQKQALLLSLVFIALIAWLIKILVSGKMEFNLSLVNIPVMVLLLVSLAATIFSTFRYGSFWGWPLNVSDGFLTLILFVFLYFLIANIFNKKEETFRLILILLASGFLAALFSSFQIFGKYLLPFDFTKSNSFNTIGTVNSVAIFLAFLFPLLIVLLFGAKKLSFWLLSLVGLIFLANLIFINFWISWLILILETAVLLAFLMINLKITGNVRLIVLPMTLLVLSLFFVIFRVSFSGIVSPPAEVSPSYLAETNIAKDVFKENSLLGSGPGTFVYNYSKFKSKDLNQTIFWNVRFGKGASEILDRLITTGALGILSLFSLFVLSFWAGIRYLKRKQESIAQEKTGWLIALGVFSAFIGIIVGQFFYTSNFSLMLVFWIITALIVGAEKERIRTFNLEPSSTPTLTVSFLLVLVLIFGSGLVFLFSQKYLAEAKYLQSQRLWQQGKTELAANELTKAIGLNQNLDNYWRDISQIYLVKVNEVLRDSATPLQEKTIQVRNLTQAAIEAAKRATDLNPANVVNWINRGFVYRNFIGLAGGAEDWAQSFYQKALELEPNNPYIFTELGIVQISKSDLQSQQKREENLLAAQDYFQKAIELKGDYAPAHFQIAQVKIREGKTKEAIERLEITRMVAPGDIGLAFQLGVLYYNDNQLDRAQIEFERAVFLDPNYSNARYFLGLIYDKTGNKPAAIEQFEIITQFNPDNDEVERILANLRGGKPALEGIAPTQPPTTPIQEKPAKIER